jgi:hypothetical protein
LVSCNVGLSSAFREKASKFDQLLQKDGFVRNVGIHRVRLECEDRHSRRHSGTNLSASVR